MPSPFRHGNPSAATGSVQSFPGWFCFPRATRSSAKTTPPVFGPFRGSDFDTTVPRSRSPMNLGETLSGVTGFVR